MGGWASKPMLARVKVGAAASEFVLAGVDSLLLFRSESRKLVRFFGSLRNQRSDIVVVVVSGVMW